MKLFWAVVWTYAVFVAQTSVAGDLAIGGYAPHLLLAGLTLTAVRLPQHTGLLLAATWGLLAGCLSDGRLGPEVLCYAGLVFVIQRFNGRWPLQAPVKLGPLSVAIAWCGIVGPACLNAVADGRRPDLAALSLNAAGPAIYTGAVVALAAFAAALVGSAPSEPSPVAPKVANRWRMLTE